MTFPFAFLLVLILGFVVEKIPRTAMHTALHAVVANRDGLH